MGLKKIIKNLQKILGSKKSGRKKRINVVQDLMNRLERKESRYRLKQALAENKTEIKRLEHRLKACSAQLKKGQAALKAMLHEEK